LKRLPWADQDNYRICYDEQRVTFRVPDMKQFNEQQLHDVFAGCDVGPAKLVDITMLSAASDDAAVPPPDALKELAGEWQTDDEASQKFWLNIRGRRLRLHTTMLGDWNAMTRTILDAGTDWIRYTRGTTGDDSRELKYRRDGEALVVSIPAGSVYQGEFRLFRVQ
jgi:hypothetical protein